MRRAQRYCGAMDKHSGLRYRRTERMLECSLYRARIAYASELLDGRWELRCEGDDYPSWHDDFESALREMARWARAYAWSQTRR